MRLPSGTEWLSSWRSEGTVLFRYSVFIRNKDPLEGTCECTQLDDSQAARALPIEGRLVDFHVCRIAALSDIARLLGPSDQAAELLRDVELYLSEP
jgi:hypothetical protein